MDLGFIFFTNNKNSDTIEPVVSTWTHLCELEVLSLGDATEKEKLVDQYQQENNNQAAVQLLVELIVKYAEEHILRKAGKTGIK